MSTDNARYKCVLARPWLLLAELIVSSGAVRVELVGVLLGCGSHSCERQRGLVRPLFAKSAHSSSLPPAAAAMIKGVLVVNNHGKPRLVKFYESLVRAGPRMHKARFSLIETNPSY